MMVVGKRHKIEINGEKVPGLWTLERFAGHGRYAFFRDAKNGETGHFVYTKCLKATAMKQNRNGRWVKL